MQLDDIILPENNVLRPMNSITGIFDDILVNPPAPDYDENFFNPDQGAMPLEFDMYNYHAPIRVEEEPLMP